MRRACGLIVGLVAVFAAACGGGGKSHVASVNGHPDPQAIASKIGCTGYSASNDTELFAATGGDCQVDGHDVTVVTFASGSSQSKWAAAAKAATGGDGAIVLGDRFAVEADNADTASMIAVRVGGRTQ